MFQINETELLRGSGSCNYKIDIKTSCSSPEHTTDTIDIIIGDANGNQVVFSTTSKNIINHMIAKISIYESYGNIL
jgi:hypothetical protein